MKISFHSYANETNFHIFHLASLHNEVQCGSEMTYYFLQRDLSLSKCFAYFRENGKTFHNNMFPQEGSCLNRNKLYTCPFLSFDTNGEKHVIIVCFIDQSVFLLSSRFVASLRLERATIQEPIFEAKGGPWTAVD